MVPDAVVFRVLFEKLGGKVEIFASIVAFAYLSNLESFLRLSGTIGTSELTLSTKFL